MIKNIYLLLIGILLVLPMLSAQILEVQKDENGYYINNTWTIYSAFYMPSVDKIFIVMDLTKPQRLILIEDDMDISKLDWSTRGLIKHERCHQQQNYNGKEYNELECYFKQFFIEKK